MKLRKTIIAVVFLAFALFILLPPILHGYVYPNNGDDAGHQVSAIIDIKDGKISSTGSILYAGQYVVGYPMIWVNELTGLPIIVQFTWFSYFVLIAVGVSVWALVRLLDWRIGLFAVFIVGLCAPLLNIYDTGAIFDLITVGIIYPLLVLSIATYDNRKKWRIAPVIILLVLAIGLHSIGVFYHDSLEQTFMPYNAVAITIFALVTGAFIYYKSKKLTIVHRRIVFTMAATMVALGVLAIVNFRGWGYRVMLDTELLVILYVVVLMPVIVYKWRYVVLIGVALVALNIPTMLQYVQYNSAVKPADKQAIEYLKTLDSDYFSCSPEVAPWIYRHYIDKQYEEGELPYIARDKPMTPATVRGSHYYWAEDMVLSGVDMSDAVVFDDGEVRVYVVH